MYFSLIDEILERHDDRFVALKRVQPDDWFLADHFPTFPVLPGVLMIEALVQTARSFIDHTLAAEGIQGRRYALGSVRALKFGSFVKPGQTLWIEVSLNARDDDEFRFKGLCKRLAPGETPEDAKTTVSGRFTLRPLVLSVSPARILSDAPSTPQ